MNREYKVGDILLLRPLLATLEQRASLQSDSFKSQYACTASVRRESRKITETIVEDIVENSEVEGLFLDRVN